MKQTTDHRTILIYGLPHSGKTTLARAISARFDAGLADVGVALRRKVETDQEDEITAAGRKAVSSNTLLPDSLAQKLVCKELGNELDRDIILVGYPRTLTSIPAFLASLKEKNRSTTNLFLLQISMPEELSRKLAASRARGSDASPALLDYRYQLYRENDRAVIERLSRVVKPAKLRYSDGAEKVAQNAMRVLNEPR